MSVQKIEFYDKLSDVQKQRINSHAPTVSWDGSTFNVTSETVFVPKNNYTKTVKTVSVAPTDSETVAPIVNNLHLFKDLKHMNVILTNACNLSCTYCYEQHNKDYGQFDVVKLKKLYDFHVGCNYKGVKVFQFFGGEPLIHKDLILSFLEEHGEEMALHSHKQMISINTNGILLTPDFIETYFGYDFTIINISLDTTNAEIDKRELTQKEIDHILDMVSLVPQRVKDQKRLSIRCTISTETAVHLSDFIDDLYINRGVRTMVIHPLTMSSLEGFVQWTPEQWNGLHDDISNALNKYDDFSIQFSEGIGTKHDNNCLVGSDMIAVDASGDFSGCYFFTNHKAVAGHTILGNLLAGVVYTDRYTAFHQAFEQMFENEQCKSCNLQNLCYQCPAGNLDTGGQLFRPDDMCQSIVQLFIDLQHDRNKKQFVSKFNNLLEYTKEKGEQFAFAKSLVALMYRYVNDEFHDTTIFDQYIDKLPNYQTILKVFAHYITRGEYNILPPVEQVKTLFENVGEEMTIKEFYEFFTSHKRIGIAPPQAGVDDINKRVFYLTLVHFLILDKMEARPV